MNSKIIDIAFSKEQADYSEQYFIQAKYQNVKKQSLEDLTVAELSGDKAPFKVTPVKYYDNRNGELWLITADVP